MESCERDQDTSERKDVYPNMESPMYFLRVYYG